MYRLAEVDTNIGTNSDDSVCLDKGKVATHFNNFCSDIAENPGSGVARGQGEAAALGTARRGAPKSCQKNF